MMFAWTAVLVVLLMSLVIPNAGRGAMRPLKRLVRVLARRRWWAIGLVGLLALAINVGMSVLVHWPVPAVHDEFCYLLGADTFAHGRLTNPTHPMWEHFETFHVIHQPTYQMKYPPGQSLALAAGQAIAHPLVGVWLSFALACSATCWMLYGWLPARWALFGGLLPLLNQPLLVWWGQSYWGGAVAMLGGALVFGALRRIAQRPRVHLSITFALGLGILANTRPYEGLIAALCTLLVWIPWLFQRRPYFLADAICRFIVPVILVLATVAAWMGYYNHRVTGHPLRMPYQTWEATYSGGSVLSTMFSTHEAEGNESTRRVIPLPERGAPRGESRAFLDAHPLLDGLRKLLDQWSFFVGPALTVPLLTIGRLWRDRWSRFAMFTVAMVLGVFLLQDTWGHPHYLAPVYAVLLALLGSGLRYVRCWQVLGRPVGQAYVRWLPMLLLAILVYQLYGWSRQPVVPFHSWSLSRAELQTRLEKEGGKHLVVVRYDDGHHMFQEWVYNGADLDSAPVIWARELSGPENQRLLNHYRDREVWLVEADSIPPRLTRHRSSEGR